MVVGAEVGVPAEAAVSAEVPAGIQPGTEVGLDMFGVLRPVASSSVRSVWYK